MSNIAEGFERGTLTELNQFLGYAKGSCGEVRSQLYEALDADLISARQFEELRTLAISTSRLIGALKSVT
jgi:four helix bundle protein